MYARHGYLIRTYSYTYKSDDRSHKGVKLRYACRVCGLIGVAWLFVATIKYYICNFIILYL